MTGPDFRARLDALGIRPGALARRTGRRPEAVSRWFRDGPEPYAVALLDAVERLSRHQRTAWLVAEPNEAPDA